MRERKTENPFKIGKSIVAAETGVVAKKQQHESERERLRDNREVDAPDTRAESEPAKNKSQQPRHQDNFQCRQPKIFRARPIPGKLFPVEKHHEVGKKTAVLPLVADFAH